MKINEIDVTNKKDIEKLYIHDTYIENINIDYNDTIIMTIFLKNDENCFKIVFKNIIRLDLYKLSLWGKTNNQVLEIYLENYDIKEYIQQKEKFENAQSTKDTDILFTVGILADNGDRISITCEKVIFAKLS